MQSDSCRISAEIPTMICVSAVVQNITYYFPIYFETKYTSLGQFVCLCFHSKLLPETDFARVQRSQKKVVSKLRVYVKKKKKIQSVLPSLLFFNVFQRDSNQGTMQSQADQLTGDTFAFCEEKSIMTQVPP